MPLNNTLIIVDLDYTLVKVNTIPELLKRIDNKKFKIFSILLSPVLFLNSIFKEDFYTKILLILCLRGIPKRALKKHAKKYYNFLKKNKNEYYNSEVLNLINNKKGQKILISGSMDIIVNNFKELGFQKVIGSPTYYNSGKFYSISIIIGKKHSLLKDLLKDFDNIIVIDDNPEPEFYNMDKNVTVMKVKRNQKIE